MHLAVMHGMHELVEYLVIKGADLEKEDIDGNTAFIYAIDFRRRDVVHMMYQKFGISLLDSVDNDMNPMISRAIIKNSWGCFALMLQLGGL